MTCWMCAYNQKLFYLRNAAQFKWVIRLTTTIADSRCQQQQQRKVCSWSGLSNHIDSQLMKEDGVGLRAQQDPWCSQPFTFAWSSMQSLVRGLVATSAAPTMPVAKMRTRLNVGTGATNGPQANSKWIMSNSEKSSYRWRKWLVEFEKSSEKSNKINFLTEFHRQWALHLTFCHRGILKVLLILRHLSVE